MDFFIDMIVPYARDLGPSRLRLGKREGWQRCPRGKDGGRTQKAIADQPHNKEGVDPLEAGGALDEAEEKGPRDRILKLDLTSKENFKKGGYSKYSISGLSIPDFLEDFLVEASKQLKVPARRLHSLTYNKVGPPLGWVLFPANRQALVGLNSPVPELEAYQDAHKHMTGYLQLFYVSHIATR
ncbi:hypothetical protein AKJ16_DCAP23954 [Drosera capensis]